MQDCHFVSQSGFGAEIEIYFVNGFVCKTVTL